MTVRVDPHWSYRGLPAVRLENRWLALEVLPDLGAKIFRLIDKVADRNVLWENPRIPPHRAAVFASIDDHWSGGWDEAFPTCGGSVDRYGEPSPYLGELWTATSWSWRLVEASPHRVSLECSVLAPITPARYTRTLTITDDAPVMRTDIVLEHVGTRPFDYILGTHPGLAVTTAHRFDVPATEAEVGEYGGEGRLGIQGDRYAWPDLVLRDGTRVDVRHVGGPETASFALHYLSGLRAGWAACTDTAAQRGFGLVFDPSVFRFVYLWQDYGGFRGHQHAALELWTGAPAGLADAVAAGRADVMDPGDRLETTLHTVLYGGVASVGSLSADGSVAPAADDPA